MRGSTDGRVRHHGRSRARSAAHDDEPPEAPLATVAWADLRLRRPRRLATCSERPPPAAVPPRLDVPRPGAARVPARRGLRPHLPPDVRRPLLRAGRPHRQDDLEPPHEALRLGVTGGLGTARRTSRSSGDARPAATRCPATTASSWPTHADSGKVAWQRTTGPNESSPLVAGGLVYVGGLGRRDLGARRADGPHALDRSGRDGRIKGSLALSGGQGVRRRLRRHVYALDARTGRLAWRASRSRVSAVAAPSTRRRRPATAASSSAARTARSTRSVRPADGCSGRRARAATSTPRRRSGAG